ncbi:MAG TPA: isoprenylcysteine carboxylmethyltransferase family protein [Thermoanaerobaculia bacterium]|nr:isoprenylcysteine carboxylmethyltransferase family protein [Thermoanaerobaculia bacterium]
MVSVGKLAVQIVSMSVVYALMLFLGAGTIAWAEGWIFLALFFGFTIAISAWLLKVNPGLLQERMTGIGKRDQKKWDKVFSLIAAILFFGWMVLIPIDAVRYRWSHVPLVVKIIGAAIVLWSFYLHFLVFRENSYLSSAVRIQTDRGQTVVSTGPYARVRHPMYAAAQLMLAGASLLLGSWLGLVALVPLTIAIAFRAIGEERTLRAELPGYDEYMRNVRYRFIPRVW